MKIICINGPNLNLLGKRNKTIYGKFSLSELQKQLTKEFPNVSFTFFQSNIEGEIVDKIQEADRKFDGIIINPGGYSHTSVAIKDALDECKIPKIEVHLSNLAARENFRQQLITAKSCEGYISGFKDKSYSAAVYILTKIINKRKR